MRAFVNDIKASHHNENTVYVAFDDHKNGDFSPYILKSTDRGESWELISEDLPDRHLVWRTVQDHENEDLLFAATEFGVFFTVDGGENWQELNGNVPTISFRDVTIQREHEDLVLASFGRSFWILDDYSPLRNVNQENLSDEAHLFGTRDAFWFIPNSVVSSMGGNYYKADNPPYGAVFTYYLKDGYESLESQRKQSEQELEADQDVPFPGWDKLEREIREEGPRVILTVKDQNGNVVNKVAGPASKGFHRVNWELEYPSKDVVNLEGSGEGFYGSGFMATPGTYTVSLSKFVRGEITQIAEPDTFEVVPLQDPAIEGSSDESIVEFRENLEQFQQNLTQATNTLRTQLDKVNAMQRALMRAEEEAPELAKRLNEARLQLLELNEVMNGSEAKNQIGERNPPSPRDRLFTGYRALSTTYGPTEMHREQVEIGKEELDEFEQELNDFVENVMPSLEKALEEADAPPLEDH